jgi:trimeric autotransporter adhesin
MPTLTTVPVRITVFDQSGHPVSGGRVTARLDRTDYMDGYVIAPETLEGETDDAGLCILSLWPNELGTSGSLYRVVAYNPDDQNRRYLNVMVAVPNAACQLEHILQQQPFPPIDAAQAALQAAQSALADVTEQVQIATDQTAIAAGHAAATQINRLQTGLDVAATTADRVQTGLDRQATAADRTQTGLDAAATAADRVQTELDRQATAADRQALAAAVAQTDSDAEQTALDRQATTADAEQTTLDAAATAADRIQTGLDRQAAAADRTQTGLDRQATAADRVQTALDLEATAAYREQTGLDASATASDRVSTGLDRQATAADRTQTGLDRQAVHDLSFAASTSASDASVQRDLAAQQVVLATSQVSIASAYAMTATSKADVAAAQASLAAGYAASASSVVQQDLSGVTAAALHRSPSAVTALFVYDTSKDSDGGAWTEKCQHTSWYNEPINGQWLGAQASEAAARAVSGATTGDYFQLTTDGKFYKLNATSGTTGVFRGNKRDFPRLAGIVAQSSAVTIYDLTEPSRPMWMHFQDAPMYSSSMASISAVNGIVSVASAATYGRLTIVNFPKDTGRGYRGIPSTNATQGDLIGGIAKRQTAVMDNTQYRIANDLCNAVAMTVLPDAPVDPVTWLQVPTIAVQCGTQLSIINNNETVVNSGTLFNGGLMGVLTMTPKYVASRGSGYAGAEFFIWKEYWKLANGFTGGNINRDSYSGSAGYKLITANGENISTVGSGVTKRRYSDSTDFIDKLNRTTYLKNTGWSPKSLRRAYFCETNRSGYSSISQGNILPNGTFDDATGWTLYGATTISGGILNTNGNINGNAARIMLSATVKPYTTYVVSLNGTGAPRTLVIGDGEAYYTNAELVTVITNANPTNLFTIRGQAGGTFTIDNLTVSEGVCCNETGKPLVLYGTLTKSAVASAAELVAYSGFSASNYLREPYSADLDFGMGEWTCSAWVNVPVTLPVGGFPFLDAEWFVDPDITNIANFPAEGAPTTREIDVDGNLRIVGGHNTGVRISSIPNKIYRYEIEVKLNSGALKFELNYSGSSQQIVDMESGWQRRSFIASGGGYLVLAGSGSVDAVIRRLSIREVDSSRIADRAHTSGAKLNLGITGTGLLTATAYDGTTTRTVTTTAAYNTATWLKVRANYTTDGTLALLVNGVEVAATRGAPLLTLNNSNAVLTIGNSYAADAPFPGSIALLKLSATVPTAEQSVWMYEQEKQLFRDGAQCCLPDSGAIVDLTYDDATDKWIAVSATNESEWSGLVRTSVTPVPAGSYTKAAAASGVQLLARSTTSPGVDITIPAYGLREELVKRAESAARLARNLIPFDYVGGFTASTTNGSTSITSVASLSYPTSYIGAKVTGSGIPADTVITAVRGTTIYLSKAATATATGVQISFTDFILPVGYEAKDVLLAGVSQKEGSTAAFSRLFDGFKEAIRFGTAPAYNANVTIQAARSIQ